jgi:hypothetical protein
MAAKGNFFSKFLSFILVLIIISGVGFLGYNLLTGSGGMNMTSMTTGNSSKTDATTNANTTDNSSKNTMNMSGSSSKDSMNMGNSTSSNTNDTQYSTTVINAVLQNKDNLDKTITALNDSLKLMTLDPYGVDAKQQSSTNSTTTQAQQNNGQNQTTTTNGASTQGGTTVNIYPQNGTTNQTTAMQSMGTTYDAAKMEKLHTGLYKVSVGIQLLNQLKSNLSSQLEQASMEVKNPSQYYYTQYLLTVQNKTKLTEALTNINEASSLVNINPYVSQNGAVYDKERMTNIHDSIYKLAQVVVDLNKINDNFSNQAITLGNVTQNYINNAQSTQNMNMTSTGTSFLSNINMVTVFNILVIVFIIIFIVSILGFIGKILKSPKNTSA